MSKLSIGLLLIIPACVFAQSSSVEGKDYTHVDQIPQFPGGIKALIQLFNDSVELPNPKWQEEEPTEENNRIVLSFIVDEQGNVSDVKVVHSMTKIMDEKYVNLVKKLKFIPAYSNGKPVKVRYTLPYEYEFPPR